MTSTTARTLANVVLVSAGVAAAYLVITKPPVRRMARLALHAWLGATVPAYLLVEARRAWESSRAA